MLSDAHPDLHAELEGLANSGFKYECAIGKIFGKIDALFIETEPDTDIASHWSVLPYADAGISRTWNLRCIDSDDGLVTLLCAMRELLTPSGREDVLLLLSAGKATKRGRAAAVIKAGQRVSDVSWARPA